MQVLTKRVSGNQSPITPADVPPPSFTTPETEYVPMMSRLAGAPITNVGSGLGVQGNAQTNITPSKSGSAIPGAIIGALTGTAAGALLGNNPLGALTSAVKKMMTGTATAPKPPTSTQIKVPQTGSGTNGALAGIGTVNTITFPPGTTQAIIDAQYPPVNGQPQYTPSGVDMKTGDIIATPNYNIGGANLTGSPAPTDTSPLPATSGSGYFQDASGNIYDSNGQLYAVNTNGTYYVNQGNGNWVDANSYVDPNANSNTNSSAPIDYTAPVDTTSTYTPVDTTAPVDNSVYTPIDTTIGPTWRSGGSIHMKQGGLNPPLMANGGGVKMAYGGGTPTATDNGDGTWTYTYPDGTNQTVDSSGTFQAGYDANGNVIDASGNSLSGATVATPQASGATNTSSNPLSGITNYVSNLLSPSTGGTTSGTLSGIQGILSNGTVQGTLLGALLSQIMSSSSGGTNQGVDMSKVGNIAPRTTNFGVGPANFATYGQYGQPVQPTNQYNDLYGNLGVTGYNPPTSPNSTINNSPSFSNVATNTPNKNGLASIIPESGMPNANTQIGQIGGTPVSSASGLTSLTKAPTTAIQQYQTIDQLKNNPNSGFNYGIDQNTGGDFISSNYDANGNYIIPTINANSSSNGSMANGGLAKPSQTHYTFGNAVDPLDFLAGGGQAMNLNVPMTGGVPVNANVPMLQGRKDYRNGAYVEGAGDGQSDSIPAMLADGEYVMDADVVSSLGNGSNKAGAKVLDKMRENIRTHNRSTPINSIPSKAKSPLAYMKGAK